MSVHVSTPKVSRVVSSVWFPNRRTCSYFWADHSRARLKVTRQMLVRTLTYHQVMPGYLHFLSAFGQQTRPHNARFSGFREQTSLAPSFQEHAIPDLGRSGRHFQLCYNLKSVACTSAAGTPEAQKQWSIRQVAICHQFDVVEGTTLWVLTKGALDLKDRIKDMTGRNGRPEDRSFGSPQECFQSSLAVHLLFAHWASVDWRWRIQWLEDMIDAEVSDTDFVGISHAKTPGLDANSRLGTSRPRPCTERIHSRRFPDYPTARREGSRSEHGSGSQYGCARRTSQVLPGLVGEQ
jgi:hypothetical protein